MTAKRTSCRKPSVPAGAAYEKLLAFLRAHHFTISGFSREVTLIDNGLTDDPGKFVTEISLPVCPAE